ncbi:MAG: hydroxyphenylacetyl-CoA thioesterase PaaI [Clostridia bacterium]
MSKPRFPDDREIHRKHYDEICEKLAKDAFGQYLGIRLLELGEGRAVAEVTVDEHMLNAHGTVHGGLIFSLADFVFAAASNSYGKTSVALSMNIGYMAAARTGERLVATAVEENRTPRTAWYRIKVENERGLVAALDALVYRKSEYFVSIEDETV